ncbi:GNAT family N-acetyltransferase, partial [Streptomyces alfalfae]
MTTDLRSLAKDEWDTWYRMLDVAFGGVPESPDEQELWRALTECERSIGVWDGEACVGSAGAFSFRLCVPGGALVDAAGVTMVGVAATHRRRGILTSMMRRQLDDVRALGEPLAVLTASEPAIYGRFGYGTATQQMKAEIDTSRVRLSTPAGTDDVALRYARPADVHEACEELYARVVAGRPGMLARQPGWERLGLLDPKENREGASPLQCVVAERSGELAGYVRFSVKPEWDWKGPKGAVQVRDIEALDPAAYAALWRFLFGIDLTSSVLAANRPVDDPLLQLVSDVRRCDVSVRDSLHVRLVDVGAALAARAYQMPLDVVLDVDDAFCPW